MYIITSKTRGRMMRDRSSQVQIQQERNEYFKSKGIGQIQPLKGQTEDQVFEDIKKNESKVQEQLAEQSEINKKNRDVQKKQAREKKQKEMKANLPKLIEKKKAGKIR